MTQRESARGVVSQQSSSQALEVNVGTFIDHFHKLTELLHPLSFVGKAVIYVIRSMSDRHGFRLSNSAGWENYLLTLVILVFLSVLLYFPALFLSFLILLCIVSMGVGWYRQTYTNKISKTTYPDHIERDQQTLKRHHKEQKNSHKALVECVNLLQKADSYILSLTNVVEYIQRIVSWKSREVSLCVTVLLCVVLVLLCMVYLRVIAACLPVVILCSNTHFLRKTVNLWKRAGRAVIQLRRIKPSISSSKDEHEEPPLNATGNEIESIGSSSGSSSMEVAHHAEPSADTAEVNLADVNASTSNPNSVQVNTDSDDNRVNSLSTSLRSRAVAQDGSTADPRDSPNPQLMSKDFATTRLSCPVSGFCYNCNVSFAKLLKRKHDCSNCGQSFCGSCTVKVKKCLLGATSPSAYEETVRVCQECNSKLKSN